jgi:chromosome segregation ATPase
MSPPPASPEADLESTAELPVLDPAVAPEGHDEHGSTDTWAALPQLRPDSERHLEATLEAMSAELRSAQQLLNSKSDRLRDLERERDEAQSEATAAERRAAELTAAATRQESLGAEQAVRLAEAAQARVNAEQHAAGLAAQLAHLRAGGDAGTREHQELRVAAEERAAQLVAELSRLQSAATAHAAQFGELTQARAVATERSAQLEGELSAARAELAEAHAQSQQLALRVSEHSQAAEAERTRHRESEQARAVRERAQAAHVASVMADLHAQRTRALAYFESLQSVSSRRSIFEELVADMHQEAQVREAELTRLTHQLSAREGHQREQDGELAERVARAARLEQEITRLGAALAERDAQLRDGKRDAQGLHSNIARLQAQLESSGERVRALSTVAEQHNTTEAQRKSELSRLLSERVELTTALEAARAGAASDAAQAAAQEQAAQQQQIRTAELERLLAAEHKRAEQLEEDLANLRRDMEDWGDALKSVHQERGSYQSAMAAAEARAREAERRADEQQEALASAQALAGSHAGRVRELEADLIAAEEAVHRLESEARKSGVRLEELVKANQQWRATLEEVRSGVSDTSAHPVLRDAPDPETEAPPLPDGAVRMLIESADGREIVHVLGRKTSVGRTPDNDLRIDAKFISRHHAVILAGPAQTIIEDLNSTNGVQVNGRRITRQVLEDGDTISIGRQVYRFALRKKDDKR